MTGTPDRGGRAESVVQVLILLAIGGMAAAASFTHVHDLTVKHGQPSWIGWANAVALELMSIAVGLEIRRRMRTRGHAGGFLIGVLVAAAGLSLAAQVADAQRSVWGWIVAAIPAAAFLTLVKVVLSRSAHTDDTEESAVQPETEDQAVTVVDTEPASPAADTTPEPEPEDGRPVFASWVNPASTEPARVNGHPAAEVAR